ncbi:hypothetical protein [Helcococcus sueciensis]|uniref:hypothetical protein n=1 Tax=Helcococcus sueciensis TaxID=241555 RepID=UPI0003FEF964|nr:hypothetical protein [Helcococcus sueciensis]
MIDILKENLGRVITLIQEKYGELTKDEVSQIQENPKKLYEIVEDKFGIKKEKLDEYLSGIADKLNLSNPDNPTDSVGAALQQGKNIFDGYDPNL